MNDFTTIGLVCWAALVILGMLSITIRLDPAARAKRRSGEAHIRRSSARLVREAEHLLRARTR